jgi:hypothetical protein
MITSSEVMDDRRIRLAVMKGEYTRSISLFLRIKHPCKTLDEIARLPNELLLEAQRCIDNAFLDKWRREKEMTKEMR